jgi:hypothetical protein
MKLKYLMEEFSDYAKNDAEEFFSIFKNPSLKDYDEIKKESKKALEYIKDKELIEQYSNEFRFLLDTLKKDVYAFSIMILHQDAIKALKKNTYGLIKGRGIIKSPRFEIKLFKTEIPDWAKKYLGQK